MEKKEKRFIKVLAESGGFTEFGVERFTDSITERGQEGSRVLTAFLIDPVNFYSIVNKL